jgi:hypothetical protein
MATPCIHAYDGYGGRVLIVCLQIIRFDVSEKEKVEIELLADACRRTAVKVY